MHRQRNLPLPSACTLIPYHSFDRCNYPRTRGTVRSHSLCACVYYACGALPALSETRPRRDTCACRVSQIFPSLFDKYRISSRSTKPQRHENRIRETTRERASVSGIIHTRRATMRRVVSASCAYPLVSPSFSLFLVSCGPPPRGSLECVHARRGARTPGLSRAPRTSSRYTSAARRVTSWKVDRPHAQERVHSLFYISRSIAVSRSPGFTRVWNLVDFAENQTLFR